MKVTVFGATGRTGRWILEHLLADGHDVTAYVRNPDKIDRQHERLTVIAGDMDNAPAIAAAVAGSEAVISALGPVSNTPDRPLTRGMGHIGSAMQEHGVRRLIAATGAGVADPNDRPQLIGRLMGVALRLFARHVLADSQGMVAAIRESDLDWTLARAPRLTDGESGPLKVGYAGRGPGMQLARADFARFMVDQLTSDAWVQKAPMVSN